MAIRGKLILLIFNVQKYCAQFSFLSCFTWERLELAYYKANKEWKEYMKCGRHKSNIDSSLLTGKPEKQ